MTEVISVEVDGEVDDDGRFSPDDRRPPRWGLPVAIAVAGVLFLAVLILVVLPALTGAGKKPNTEAAEGRDATRTAQEEAPERAPEMAPADPRIDSAAKALAAWGQFATTGDLAVVEGLFDKEGPQYRALKEEAPAIAGASGGRTPYRVTLSGAAVKLSDSRQATVEGQVIWARQAERDQVFVWQIVVKHGEDGRWLVWTIRGR